jgi:perosamine synthetase
MKASLPLFRIYWDDSDVEAATKVIVRGSHWADGPEIPRFEAEVARYVGVRHACAFANGTAALHALMVAYGLGPGDEVVVPSFTFISTANAPLFVGAKPVFADIEPETFGLDPSKIKVTRRTRAIMPIHYGGHPCQIKELKNICEEHGLVLIEDAAEALGAKCGGNMLGKFGDSTMFSFCQNKVITTGEGGIVVTDDGALAGRLALIRSHGRAPGDHFGGASLDYVQLGYNLRMPSMCAAVGLAQMGKIERVVSMRRRVARAISGGLSKVKGLELPVEVKGSRHVYQMYTVKLRNRKARDRLKEGLAKAGVASKVYFEPVHLTRFYRERLGCRRGDLPVTEELAGRVLSLPIFPDMCDEEIDYLVKCVKKGAGG